MRAQALAYRGLASFEILLGPPSQRTALRRDAQLLPAENNESRPSMPTNHTASISWMGLLCDRLSPLDQMSPHLSPPRLGAEVRNVLLLGS